MIRIAGSDAKSLKPARRIRSGAGLHRKEANGMVGIERFLFAFVVLCAVVMLSGCATTETTTRTDVSSAATASTESVAVNVSTETTTAMWSPPQPPPTVASSVDVLANMKKPCGTVAADAPKFVEPEDKK